MRTSVLLWSTASGLVLGLFCGVAILAVLVAGSELLAPAVPRLAGRARVAALVLCLVALPVAGAVLGYLEGRLKLR
jgi:hypothetical protein